MKKNRTGSQFFKEKTANKIIMSTFAKKVLLEECGCTILLCAELSSLSLQNEGCVYIDALHDSWKASAGLVGMPCMSDSRHCYTPITPIRTNDRRHQQKAVTDYHHSMKRGCVTKCAQPLLLISEMLSQKTILSHWREPRSSC